MTTDIRIGHPSNGPIRRFKDLVAAGEVRGGRPARPSRLTSRDVEAEALARLARGGYDWAGAPGR